MRSWIFAISVAAVSAVGLGCPGRGDVYDGPLSPLGPLVVDGQLVWSVPSARTMIAIDPADRSPSTARALPFAPRHLASAGGRVLMVGSGDAGPALASAPLDDGAITQVSLPTRYDRVLPSPDGRYAVLIYDPASAADPGAPAARNANEVAIVDIDARRATRVALGTESLAPRAVVFSPADDLAAVVLDGAVVIVDLTDPSRRLLLPLTVGQGTALVPQEALFAPDGRHLFIRALGSSDVLSLAIEAAGPSLAGQVNFLFVPGGTRALDIVVLDAPGFESSVVGLFESGRPGVRWAAMLEAGGDRSQTRAVEIEAEVDRIVSLGEARLLLHAARASGGGAAIAGWEPLLERIDIDRLAGPPLSAPAVGGKLAFFRHTTGAGGPQAMTAVSLVSDATRMRVRLQPLVLSGDVQGTAADADSDRVVLGIDVPRRDSGAAPTYEDSEDFSGKTGSLVVLGEALGIDAVVFDEVITAVGTVGDHYYAVHPDPFGDITFVPKDDLSRGAAHRRDGFLLSGLLDLEDER